MLPGDQWDSTGAEPCRMETRDHVFPRALIRVLPDARSERWRRLNKVRACAACNGRKGDTHPLAWLGQLTNPAGIERLACRLIVLGVPVPAVRAARGLPPKPLRPAFTGE